MVNQLNKKCPKCKRIRKFIVPPDHLFSDGREWGKINDQWVCHWCIARETPDGEDTLRARHAEIRKIKKSKRKKFRAVCCVCGEQIKEKTTPAYCGTETYYSCKDCSESGKFYRFLKKL